MSTQPFPESYNTFTLPDIRFSHHPASSPSVTPVVLVILNRPKFHNAFTSEMTESLVQAFDLLSADPRVRVVVVTGSDPTNRTFCAGMDLVKATAKGGSGGNPPSLSARQEEETVDTHRDGGGRVSLAMYRCRKPVIAAINGSAVGVGITMTLAANVRVVSSRAKVGFVFARRGITLEACSSFFLPRLVGAAKALHLVTTGAVYPATDPLVRDLFGEVVEPERVVPRALEIAEDVAANVSGVSARVMKDMIFRGPASPEEAHLLESRLFFEMFRGRDAAEGMRSFMEKRPPSFRGTVEADAPSAYPWWTDVDVKVKSKI